MIRDVICLSFFYNKVNDFEEFISNNMRSKFIINVEEGNWVLVMYI